MAAFALGLLGDGRARDPLIAAPADPAFDCQQRRRLRAGDHSWRRNCC